MQKKSIKKTKKTAGARKKHLLRKKVTPALKKKEEILPEENTVKPDLHGAHEASYYEKKPDNKVQCRLCPRNCIIPEGKRGNCQTRENINGVLYSLVYGKPCAVNVDPVEKKPLFHFMPGSMTYSIGTAGCNLHCKHCQNFDISQNPIEVTGHIDLPPEKVVEEAIANDCPSISYTYNDPVVFTEYVIDTARLARKKGLKNIFVTNGYINQKPLLDLCKVIDAAHVDLKCFDDKFYMEISGGAHLQPVLDTLKTMKKQGVWFEIINLIIPTVNDNMETIEKMCIWIKNELGNDTVLHFSRFFPFYQMSHLPPTSVETLEKAREIAKKHLDFVYVGNVYIEDGENTYCPNCKSLLIRRSGFGVTENKVKPGSPGKCFKCGNRISGVF